MTVIVSAVLGLLATSCVTGPESSPTATPGDLMSNAFACGQPPTQNIGSEPDYAADYVERWETYDGCEVRLDYVMSRTGCCFDNVDDLLVGWPIGESHRDPNGYRIFLRDPGDVTGNKAVFVPDATLPAEARDTGLRWGGYSLWLVPGQDDAVWLQATDHVERWPREDPLFGCG